MNIRTVLTCFSASVVTYLVIGHFVPAPKPRGVITGWAFTQAPQITGNVFSGIHQVCVGGGSCPWPVQARLTK